MQSLNIKDRILLEFQIQKLGTPLSFLMEKMSKFNTRKKIEKKYETCAK